MDNRLHEHAQEVFAALERLAFAALCRDSTQGDPIRLFEVRAELHEAMLHAYAVIQKVRGREA